MNEQKILDTITQSYTTMDQQEKAILEYLIDESAGDTKTATLKKEIAFAIDLVTENRKLWQTIMEYTPTGVLRFLNPKPFRIALYRLAGAVREAQQAIGETNILPFE